MGPVKAIHALISAALVVVGLVVYDGLRGGSGEPTVPPPRAASASDPVARSAPVLEGAGQEGVAAALAALSARLDRLEQVVRDASRAVPPAAAPAVAAEPAPAVRPPPEWRPPSASNGGTPAFTDDDLAWFRALKKESERREEQDREREIVARQIDDAGVALSPSEREAVVALTADYRARTRDFVHRASLEKRTPSQDDPVLVRLREEYERAVHELVPPEAARRIVTNMGHYPGFPGGRRGP